MFCRREEKSQNNILPSARDSFYERELNVGFTKHIERFRLIWILFQTPSRRVNQIMSIPQRIHQEACHSLKVIFVWHILGKPCCAALVIHGVFAGRNRLLTYVMLVVFNSQYHNITKLNMYIFYFIEMLNQVNIIVYN